LDLQTCLSASRAMMLIHPSDVLVLDFRYDRVSIVR
jgi:hypothetical protein